jgi:hypothetical protein
MSDEHKMERVRRLWAFWYSAFDIPVDTQLNIHPGRHKSLWLLNGAVLPIWKVMMDVYQQQTKRIAKYCLTVVRVELANGERLVGLHPSGMDEKMVSSHSTAPDHQMHST